MKKAAIYVRKSIDTKKGESIEIQTNKCRAFCELRDWPYEVYEDFDLSAKNTDRPAFIRMMKDIEVGKVLAVVCYKLDRVSRDLADFSSFNKQLEKHGTDFVSLKEQFDTSTPMGRAMMYITAVFAQFEREQIAERVKDSMIDRAKMGRWNGGKPPYGYTSERVEIVENGKKKERSYLVIDPIEKEVVEHIFNLYLDIKSIRGVTVRLNQENISTSQGSDWNQNQVSRMLQNAVYCESASLAFDYFNNHMQVIISNSEAEFNGSYGLQWYNRRVTVDKTSKFRPESEWILAIGDHKPIIDSETFVAVQKLLDKNKLNGSRKGKSKLSPLTGIVKCGTCGTSMNVYYSSGIGYLKCRRKEQQGTHLCNNHSIQVLELEKIVVDKISDIYDNPSIANKLINDFENNDTDTKIVLLNKQTEINKRIKALNVETEKLLDSLGKGILPDHLINRKYQEIEDKIKLENETLVRLESEMSKSMDKTIQLEDIKKFISKFKKIYTGLDGKEKSTLLKSIVKEIRFNKGEIAVDLHFGPETLPSDVDELRKGNVALPEYASTTVRTTHFETLPSNTVGELIRKERLTQGLLVKEVALLTELSAHTVSAIENDKKCATSSIIKVAKVLKIDMALVLTENEFLLYKYSQKDLIDAYKNYHNINYTEMANRLNITRKSLYSYKANTYKIPNRILDVIKEVIKKAPLHD